MMRYALHYKILVEKVQTCKGKKLLINQKYRKFIWGTHFKAKTLHS